MWLCLFIFQWLCLQSSMSAWSLTNLNTRSPSISNLSAHVDLFLLVRVYLSSPSLPGLRSADLFSAAHGVHIAFIVCICMPSRPAANATFRRWSSCSCLTCVIFPYQICKVRSTSFGAVQRFLSESCTSHSPTPSYGGCILWIWHMRMQPHKTASSSYPAFSARRGNRLGHQRLVHVLIGKSWTCVNHTWTRQLTLYCHYIYNYVYIIYIMYPSRICAYCEHDVNVKQQGP